MELQKVVHFLRSVMTSPDGYGNGGGGYGNGYGNGNGGGGGYGGGYGYGNGNGNGNGYGGGGNGVKKFNNQDVYIIDDTETLLYHINGDIATGAMLGKDLILTDCYVVRNDYHFAHGVTLKEALESLEGKTLLSLPIKKRLENFKNTFKDYSTKVSAEILYNEHFKLTGSCKMGRDNFLREHNIDLKNDYISVYDFIKLTENSYKGDIIKQLK